MGETRSAARGTTPETQGGRIGSSKPGVFVLSGPTAVGKGTVCNRLKVLYPEIFVSVSATTRPPRPGEGNGVAYWFVTDDEFDRMIADDGLLEWAVGHGTHRYGTPRRPVEEAVAAGKTVILEIDLQGARQVRTTYPQATHIFLAPPSWDELVRRLQTRGTETSEQQARRLQTAARELEATSEFDEIIVNGELDPTVHKLVELMRL